MARSIDGDAAARSSAAALAIGAALALIIACSGQASPAGPAAEPSAQAAPIAATAAPATASTAAATAAAAAAATPAPARDSSPDNPRLIVDPAHQGCAQDSDCAVFRADCSNLTCVGVHRDHASRYAEPLDCAAYRGPMGNYDCMPEFHIEAPRCVASVCQSVRIR